MQVSQLADALHMDTSLSDYDAGFDWWIGLLDLH
jgi:hypothetical protein